MSQLAYNIKRYYISKPIAEVNYRRPVVQTITEYTRSTYRSINRNLLLGIVTEQAAELIKAVSSLPSLPGTTYRTFWLDNLEPFIATLKVGQIRLKPFTSTSRSQIVANRFNGNVRLTIQGKTGRDIAPLSDAPNEMETLFLPNCTFRVIRVNTNKIGGRISTVEAELIEL